MTTIRAIETRYHGCRFRSRTEARWAVVLDALAIPWHYEPEGYTLADGTGYLPDFVIGPRADHGVWAEVKGTDDHWDRLWAIAETRPVLVLGPLPDLAVGQLHVHPLLTLEDGHRAILWAQLTMGRVVYPLPWPYPSNRCVREPEEPPGAAPVAGGVRGVTLDADMAVVALAYQRGRFARFEHGETPSTDPIRLGDFGAWA